MKEFDALNKTSANCLHASEILRAWFFSKKIESYEKNIVIFSNKNTIMVDQVVNKLKHFEILLFLFINLFLEQVNLKSVMSSISEPEWQKIYIREVFIGPLNHIWVWFLLSKADTLITILIQEPDKIIYLLHIDL